MKYSNELKVGIVALLTIIAAIILFSFLKGNNVFKRTATYYVVYDNVGGITKSSPVEVYGYQTGVVQSVKFLDKTSGKLLVTLSLDKNFQIPKNTVAEIRPVSIIAGMKVQLMYGEGPGYYVSGDTLPGRLNASILTTLEEDIDPILQNVTSIVAKFDSISSSLQDILTPEFSSNINKTMANLEGTTNNIDNLLAGNKDEINNTLANLETFSNTLAYNTEKLNSIFNNLKTVSDSIATADLYTTIDNLKTMLSETSSLLNNVNAGDGNIGKLVTDENLYENINETVESLNGLLMDLNNNPKKYVHFSLFGKKQ